MKPKPGRWLSRDMWQEHIRSYTYGGQNPTKEYDPSGLWTLYGKTVSCDHHTAGFFCDAHPENPACPRYYRGWTGAWPYVHYRWAFKGCCYERECQVPAHNVERVECGQTITATKGKCSVSVRIIDQGPGAPGAVLDLHPGPAKYFMECTTRKKWNPKKSDEENCFVFGHIEGVTISG